MIVNKNIYQVSELNRQIKLLLEQQFDEIWIAGEISNFKHYPSGHMYFSLKDSHACVKGVMFAHRNRYLQFTPKDGVQVLVKAKASLYEDRGDYQLLVDYMEEAGEGILKRAFELLKQKLAAEGLFATKHKQACPPMPRCIGLITSAKGAAVHDMLTTLKRRATNIAVIIYPVQVQGLEAAKEIVQAIALANKRQECDVLIVGRGGGSLEDLQAFNTEIVARAIFASKLPIISAVGHEIDITIADFVADIRAPTPTAAAELVSPDNEYLLMELEKIYRILSDEIQGLILHHMQEIDWLTKRLKHPGQQLAEYQLQLKQLQRLLLQGMQHRLLKSTQKLNELQGGLLSSNLMHKISLHQQKLMQLQHDFQACIKLYQGNLQHQLQSVVIKLESLSPLKTLARGYSILLKEDGQIIDSVDKIAIGAICKAQLQDGQLTCEIKEKQHHG